MRQSVFAAACEVLRNAGSYRIRPGQPARKRVNAVVFPWTICRRQYSLCRLPDMMTFPFSKLVQISGIRSDVIPRLEQSSKVSIYRDAIIAKPQKQKITSDSPEIDIDIEEFEPLLLIGPVSTAPLQYHSNCAGFVMPRTFIRYVRVEGLIPSSPAAPSGPHTRQLAYRSAAVRLAFSRSRISASVRKSAPSEGDRSVVTTG